MRIWKTGAIAAALLPMAVAQALAAGKDVSSAEVQYQAGSSPLANVEMHQDINPKAPPLTKAEFTYQMSDHLPLWIQINTDIDGMMLEQIIQRKR